jgi:macrodomain Ter protein organizer (MatP/YcbG family)
MESMDGGVPWGSFSGWLRENTSPELHRKASQTVEEIRKQSFGLDEILTQSRTIKMKMERRI